MCCKLICWDDQLGKRHQEQTKSGRQINFSASATTAQVEARQKGRPSFLFPAEQDGMGASTHLEATDWSRVNINFWRPSQIGQGGITVPVLNQPSGVKASLVS